MRQAGTAPDEQQAQRFADYLLTEGISTRLEPGEADWTVWVLDEKHLERGRRELAEFLENPDDARYRGATTSAESIRREQARKNREAAKNMVDVRTAWSRRTGGVVTLVLIGVSVAVFLLQGSPIGDLRGLLFIASHVIVDAPRSLAGLSEIAHGQVWRLVTPIFLHFGFFHILFNMMWMWDLGRQIESRAGSWWFAAMVLVLAVPSNLGQYFWSGPAFGGMSGVVFGLFGYVWMRSRLDPWSGYFLHPTNVFLMIGFFLLCTTGVVGQIANVAHGVGLGVGVLLGVAPYLLRNLTGGGKR